MDFHDEVRAFKRRLALVEDAPQERQPAPRTSDRLTELPAHPFRSPGVQEEYRFPGLPVPPACQDVPTLTDTLSGIVACGGCFATGTGAYFKITDLSPLNAVHTLTQSAPGVFFWALSVNLDIPVTFYTDSGCSEGASSGTIPASVNATCSNGFFNIISSLLADDATYQLFKTDGAVLGVSFDNTVTACDGGAAAAEGSGTLEL